MNKDNELLEWTLLPEEIDFIRDNARGDENLVRYGLQLCSLRLTGRFIATYSKISLNICNYLTKQFQIDLFQHALEASHANTEVKIKKNVSEFLQFKLFDESASIITKAWLTKNGNLIVDKKALSVAIETFLVKEKFILPTSSQLMRNVFKFYSQQQLSVFNSISASLTVSQKKFIDDICKDEVKDNEYYQLVSTLKQSIGDANVKNITSKIESLNKLKHLNFEGLQFKSLDLSYIEKLHKLADHYDRSAIRRIKPDSKRYTILACHLHEVTKAAIDEIIDANDKLLGEVERRINRDFDEYYKALKNRVKKSREQALVTLKSLVTHKQRDEMTLKQFCEEVGDEKLGNIISDCEELEQFDYSGKAELARRRYSYLHKYIEDFLSFEFHVSQGSESLLSSIKLLLKHRKLDTTPEKPEEDFIETPWKQGLYDITGRLDKRSWELGLFFAVRKALRSSSLYVPQSKNHREFWAPLYNKIDWSANKTKNYEELKLPKASNLIGVEWKKHHNCGFGFLT